MPIGKLDFGDGVTPTPTPGATPPSGPVDISGATPKPGEVDITNKDGKPEPSEPATPAAPTPPTEPATPAEPNEPNLSTGGLEAGTVIEFENVFVPVNVLLAFNFAKFSVAVAQFVKSADVCV